MCPECGKSLPVKDFLRRPSQSLDAHVQVEVCIVCFTLTILRETTGA